MRAIRRLPLIIGTLGMQLEVIGFNCVNYFETFRRLPAQILDGESRDLQR